MFHQPRLLTPEVQEAICEAMEFGATLEIAAQAAGIGARTLDEWLQHGRKELRENPDAEGPCANFVRAVNIASAKLERDLLANIQAEAEKNWTARAWLLERKFPQRYAKVDRLRVSGDETNDKPIKTISREEMEDRLIEKIASVAKKALDKLGKADEPDVIEGVRGVIPDKQD